MKLWRSAGRARWECARAPSEGNSVAALLAWEIRANVRTQLGIVDSVAVTPYCRIVPVRSAMPGLTERRVDR